jgi:hypothetical protein
MEGFFRSLLGSNALEVGSPRFGRSGQNLCTPYHQESYVFHSGRTDAIHNRVHGPFAGSELALKGNRRWQAAPLQPRRPSDML